MATVSKGDSPLRVGQFTGWHGDRSNGMTELLKSDVDVLTGDYLAELTMLVLQKNQQRGKPGYVDAFATLLGDHIEEIASRRVKVITNAGGLDAEGLAAVIRQLCADRNLDLTVASIDGDDLRELIAADPSLELVNIDNGERLDHANTRILTANAYLGAWPIVEALRQGADIVVCPRTTDASLVVGAAAWHFDWSPSDYDRLASAVVAGHIIECGAQATGGNFAFFNEMADQSLPGMPIAEIEADGSCVITKSTDSGGLVSTDTVLAQLFYEIGGHLYQNPDVVTDLSSVHVEPAGTNRVRVSGTTGARPTGTAKLSLTYEGGYRNTMTIALTGENLDLKLNWLHRQVEEAIGLPTSFDECRWSVIGPADPHGSFEESTALAIISVRDRDRERVNRAHFSSRIVEIATSSIPGFYMTTPPQSERLYGVQWPSLVDKRFVHARVTIGSGEPVPVPWPETPAAPTEYVPAEEARPVPQSYPGGDTVPTPLGQVVGTRSGDKAGDANLGAWARDEETFRWLVDTLTVDRLRQLMPELEGLRIERHVFSNLGGMNFLLHGYLGFGVSACLRVDPQGKGLGEYLGSRVLDVPKELLH